MHNIDIDTLDIEKIQKDNIILRNALIKIKNSVVPYGYIWFVTDAALKETE
jgi:hypothetical protein